MSSARHSASWAQQRSSRRPRKSASDAITLLRLRSALLQPRSCCQASFPSSTSPTSPCLQPSRRRPSLQLRNSAAVHKEQSGSAIPEAAQAQEAQEGRSLENDHSVVLGIHRLCHSELTVAKSTLEGWFSFSGRGNAAKYPEPLLNFTESMRLGYNAAQRRGGRKPCLPELTHHFRSSRLSCAPCAMPVSV